MSEFKGTPGLWVVEDDEWVIDQDGNCVGAFGGIFATDKDKANATLCAAAPELLEALQAVVRVADRKTDEFDAARAAIAKALGQ